MPTFSRIIRLILIKLLVGIRPFFGVTTCPFTITCTKFAVMQLETLPLHRALWQITRRLFSCGPWGSPRNCQPQNEIGREAPIVKKTNS